MESAECVRPKVHVGIDRQTHSMARHKPHGYTIASIIVCLSVCAVAIYHTTVSEVTKTIPRIWHGGTTSMHSTPTRTCMQKIGTGMRIIRTSRSRAVSLHMYSKCYERWRALNPQATHEWYDDTDATMFMAQQPLDIYTAYQELIPGAYKADLFRLCVLYDKGGVYVDCHAVPVASIQSILERGGALEAAQSFWPPEGHGPCVGGHEPRARVRSSPVDGTASPRHFFISAKQLGRTQGSIHNGFLIVSPQHPLVKLCITAIVNNVRNRDYKQGPLEITGPICMKRALNRSAGYHEDHPFAIGKNVRGRYNIFLLSHNSWGGQAITFSNGTPALYKKYCVFTFLSKQLLTTTWYQTQWKERRVFRHLPTIECISGHT